MAEYEMSVRMRQHRLRQEEQQLQHQQALWRQQQQQQHQQQQQQHQQQQQIQQQQMVQVKQHDSSFLVERLKEMITVLKGLVFPTALKALFVM